MIQPCQCLFHFRRSGKNRNPFVCQVDSVRLIRSCNRLRTPRRNPFVCQVDSVDGGQCWIIGGGPSMSQSLRMSGRFSPGRKHGGYQMYLSRNPFVCQVDSVKGNLKTYCLGHDWCRNPFVCQVDSVMEERAMDWMVKTRESQSLRMSGRFSLSWVSSQNGN